MLDIWLYETMRDHLVCDQCWSFQGQVFTSAEIATIFPYATYNKPNVHPNCRCWLKPHPVDEERVQIYFNLTEDTWFVLSEAAKFVLIAALLDKLLEDEYERCVKNEMNKGATKKEAQKTCRARAEYTPPPTAGDEIERSKRLLSDHQARYRPLIR